MDVAALDRDPLDLRCQALLDGQGQAGQWRDYDFLRLTVVPGHKLLHHLVKDALGVRIHVTVLTACRSHMTSRPFQPLRLVDTLVTGLLVRFSLCDPVLIAIGP